MSRKSLLIATLAIGALVMVPAVGFAQGRGGRGPGGPGGPGGFGFGGPGGFGGRGGGGSEMFLLLNDQVRTELELTDDQVEKIRAASEKAREGFGDMFRDFRDLNDEQRQARMEEIRTKMTERQEQTRKELDTILLPQQTKRLKQIATQQRMRGGGPGGAGNVNGDFLAEELKLTDEQKQKLAAKAQEVEQKLRERLTKLRKEAEDEILSVLTVEQRATLKEMTGEPFEMRFGPPGQRGGQARDPRGD